MRFGGGSVSVSERVVEIEKGVRNGKKWRPKETRGTWETKTDEMRKVREETKGVRKMVLEDLEMILELQHTGLLSVSEGSLKEVPLDEEDGFLLGSVIKKFQGERECLENSLDEIKGIRRCQLKHLEVPDVEQPPIEIGLSGTE